MTRGLQGKINEQDAKAGKGGAMRMIVNGGSKRKVGEKGEKV